MKLDLAQEQAARKPGPPGRDAKPTSDRARVVAYLREDQRAQLFALAHETGRSASELIASALAAMGVISE